MLEKLYIKDYKCIDECTLNLKSLNLFAGPNSSGKSSAIQALLIASDNIAATEGLRSFQVRKTEIAQFNEARNFITNAKSYQITPTATDGNSVDLIFTAGDDAYQSTLIEQLQNASEELEKTLSDKYIMYLPATRIGGANIYSMNPSLNNKLGSRGEYVIDYYTKHRLDTLEEALLANPSSHTLEGQVNYWLEKLTGYKLLVETIGTNHYVKYETKSGKQLLPYHVGTGISFISEVLIVCLTTPQEGIVIIENPEIHLHPQAQADLIDFLAEIAKAKIQIIIESHSDHLFNGIRRLISKNILDKKDVAVYNFKQDANGLSIPELVEFTAQGGIKSYIPGMFEQFDKDLDTILGL